MTVLEVAQRAALKCGFDVPASLTGTERTTVAIVEVLNEAGRQIRDDYDWQSLKGTHRLTGDGVTEEFDLPTDYARMSKNMAIWPSDTPAWPLDHISDVDLWLSFNAQNYASANGRWTIYGDEMHIKPAPGDAVTLDFFYIKDGIFVAGDTPGPRITNGSDTFKLDENLLKLCFIYKWKQANGQTYAAELNDYQDALSVKIGGDKGPRMLAMGRRTSNYDVSVAYPGNIIP